MERLIIPQLLKQQYALSAMLDEKILSYRQHIVDIMHRRDRRLLVIVGPCSIHDYHAAIEYAKRLSTLKEKLKDKLFIVMRVYFEKPRTTLGWKGLISDPYLDGSFKINEGLALARQLLVEVNKLNLPAATEFLDALILPYINDLVSWGAIGARTVESPPHRELASGLLMPMGFKNNRDGNIQVAIDAMNVAKHSHYLLTLDDQGYSGVQKTSGNHHCHLVLRGSHSSTNYDANVVNHVSHLLTQQNMLDQVMIDCSHGNSEKNYHHQAKVVKSVCEQLAKENCPIFGIMLESNLISGKQLLSDPKNLVYGQSITDACISFEETEILCHELASAIKGSSIRMSVAQPTTEYLTP